MKILFLFISFSLVFLTFSFFSSFLSPQQNQISPLLSVKDDLINQIHDIQMLVSQPSDLQDQEFSQRMLMESLRGLEEKVQKISAEPNDQPSSIFPQTRHLNSLDTTAKSHLQKKDNDQHSLPSLYSYKPAEFCYFEGSPTPKEARFHSMEYYLTKAKRESETINKLNRKEVLQSNSHRTPSHASFPVIESVISLMVENLNDNILATLFHNCFPNTLDTTVRLYRPSVQQGKSETDSVQDIGRPYARKPIAYIITGDIPAMWLRDSTNQVWPYLPFMKYDPVLEDLLIGVLNLQTKMVIRDPYANAFTMKPARTANTGFPFSIDVWEQKWELDSLASWLRLSFGIADHLSSYGVDPTFLFDAEWQEALQSVLGVVREMTEISKYKNTRYAWRSTNTSPFEILYLGQGFPANHSGLIKSAFRPSDDASYMAFPVAANAMFYHSLQSVMKYIEKGVLPVQTIQNLKTLLITLKIALNRHSVVFHRCFGPVYAFEVDGFGNSYTMDDANIPSLLSLPYLGYVPSDDPTYLRTRELVLSEFNPFFYRGAAAQGIGSPHAWGPHWIWPLSLIIQALTSNDREEIKYCLDVLKTTHGGRFMMHESFHRDDGARFTRGWFAWANTIFGEMLIEVANRFPDLLFENGVSPLTESQILSKAGQMPTNYKYPTTVQH